MIKPKEEETLQYYQYHCERWKEDCGKAEREAAMLRKETAKLRQELADAETIHKLELDGIRKHYEKKIEELMLQLTDGRQVSFSSSNIRGVLAKIQDTTEKIERVLGIVSPSQMVFDKEKVEETMMDNDEEHSVEEVKEKEKEEKNKERKCLIEVKEEKKDSEWKDDLLNMINSM